jgi:ABC-type transporter Mla MlaB component
VISGQLTWRTSRWLHASFRRIVDSGGRELQLDLRAVSEADPAGVAVLLVYSRLLPTLGGTLEIPEASGPCRAMVERMQLPHLLGQRQVAPPAAGALDPALRSCLTDDLRQRQDERRAYSTALLGVS